MLAKFIKILITTQVNPEDGDAQMKYFNKYHQCVIFNSLIYWNFLLIVVFPILFLLLYICLFLYLLYDIISIKNKHANTFE